MQLAKGMMVTGNVRLIEPLGEGAMGSVWSAEHLTLKTRVAVKFISAELASDPLVMQRFVSEASTAAQIKSPHVVQTFDQGRMEDGTPYIVMEMLDGETLMERLERAGWLGLEEAAQVMGQVARALHTAHEKGIVHRDIKPDNIFVTHTPDGPFCKLLDFGIAKQTRLPKMGGVTSAGVMVGTPEYMSPEQVLSSKDVDYRADLWGLAVTMYHALTSRLPFTAEALGTLCVKLLDGKFTPVTELRRDLPAELDAFFLKALAHEPKDRFANAREMAVRFVEIVSHAPGYRDNTEPLSGPTPYPAAPLSGKVVTGPPGAVSALSALDATAPLSSPHSVRSETFSGSSSSNLAGDESRKIPWLAASMVGAVGVAAIVAIVALVDTGDGDKMPAAEETTAAAPPEPVASSAPSASTPSASATASTTAAPAASSATSSATPSAAPLPTPKKVVAPPSTSTRRHYNHGF